MLNILKKKQNFERIGYSLIVLFFILVASNYENPIPPDRELSFQGESIISIDSSFVEIEETIPPKKDLYAFLDDIAFKESSNRYTVQNQYGYMGKYQFSRATLNGLGHYVSPSEFMNNPELQEEAMIDLLIHNKRYLQYYIDEWVGRKLMGVEITESGILAAAHLGGQGNVRNFFNYQIDFKDGNGTPLSEYLHRFGGYDLGLDSMKNDYITDIPRKRVIQHEKRLLSR